MKQEALRLALAALEEAWYHVGTFQPTKKAIDLYDEARIAIKEALAQEQEPVAWVLEDVCEGQYIDGRPRKIWWECEKGVGTAFYTAIKEALAQPEQEPVAKYSDIVSDGGLDPRNTTPPQRTERNFCSRCGKRLGGIDSIHTCTPPQENT